MNIPPEDVEVVHLPCPSAGRQKEPVVLNEAVDLVARHQLGAGVSDTQAVQPIEAVRRKSGTAMKLGASTIFGKWVSNHLAMVFSYDGPAPVRDGPAWVWSKIV